MIKNDIGYFYDVEPLMSMESFAKVLLAMIASKTNYYRKLDSSVIMFLPVYYKRIIENIMYQEDNDWGIKFSKIIDIDKYYSSQSEWEKELGAAIKTYLINSNKQINYDLAYDYIEVNFTKEEIKDILSEYDEETLKIVDHFVSLIKNPIFNRKYKLESKELNRRAKQKVYDNNLFLKRYNGKILYTDGLIR